MRQGIVLYGPPAAGKDTITAALTEVEPRCGLFQRLKVGSGSFRNYRRGTLQQLAALSAAGAVIYRNDRYGNMYVVDRPGLDEATSRDQIPVVHLGQLAGIETLVNGYPISWLTVLLWCTRDVTAARSTARGDQDTAERLKAWDETYADLAANPGHLFDLVIRTDSTSPEASARRIADAANGLAAHRPVRVDATIPLD